MKIDGKNALVFGGARGVGRLCVEMLLQNGAKVCVADIREELGQSMVSELEVRFPSKICFVKCDITDDKEIQEAFTTVTSMFGYLDICHNSVGVIDEVDWKKMMEINLFGAISFTQHAIKHMSKEHGGHGGVIVNVASVCGLTAYGLIPAYTASKYGVIGYIRSMMDAYRESEPNLRLNAICPFIMDTQLIPEAKAFDQKAYEAFFKTANCARTSDVCVALKRFIEDETLNGECLVVSRDKGVFLDDNTKVKEYQNME